VEATNIAATLGATRSFRAAFEEPVDERTILLVRTHPIVEGLASWVLDTALDPVTESAASRCSVIRTAAVSERTVSLVVRIRYDLATMASRGELIAEEARVVAFSGSPEAPIWLDEEAANGLFAATPTGNVIPEMQQRTIAALLGDFPTLEPHIGAFASRRAEALREAHDRVRSAGRMGSGKSRVEPRLPVDILGIYIYLPHVTP
jgi:hypothetical protein